MKPLKRTFELPICLQGLLQGLNRPTSRFLFTHVQMSRREEGAEVAGQRKDTKHLDAKPVHLTVFESATTWRPEI